MKRTKKLVAMIAVALTLCMAVGGTLAWLTDTTDEVVNTFTIGNVDISLDETTSDYQMVPGCTIAKDPKVTVKADSEDCWVFVEITESADPRLSDYISYTVDSAWTKLQDGVYYREVKDTDKGSGLAVLTDNKVSVKDTVTKDMMDGLENSGKRPTLTFKAYAIQQEGFDDAEAAWKELETNK